MKTNLIATTLLTVCCVVALPAYANNATTCDIYAKDAVGDNNLAFRLGCGFANSNARWQSNYNNHYGWCLSTSSAALVSESAARDADMRPCQVKATQCETYAEQAVRQFNRNKQLGCGFSLATQPTGRWMDNHRGHYDWCMKAKPEWLSSEAKARTDSLTRCISQ